MFPIFIVVLIAVFQAAVTWWLWRSDVYERAEKSAQTKLIWLVPFLGAALVVSMLWEETRQRS
ncbi:MAG: hypothetical protein QM784_05140 [Polyangiaceae bacterium]